MAQPSEDILLTAQDWNHINAVAKGVRWMCTHDICRAVQKLAWERNHLQNLLANRHHTFEKQDGELARLKELNESLRDKLSEAQQLLNNCCSSRENEVQKLKEIKEIVNR